MTTDRTPKQKIIDKLLKEIGFFTSDQSIADLATKILGEKVTYRTVRHARETLEIPIPKPPGPLRKATQNRVGLDYKSPFEQN